VKLLLWKYDAVRLHDGKAFQPNSAAIFWEISSPLA